MRLALATALLALLPLAAHAGQVQAPELSSSQCGVDTDYDVLIDGGGVWLRRHDAVPREIVFHDGQLSIDGHMQEVSGDDVQRLRVLEAGARQLMPAVTGIANDTVGITFEALDATFQALTGKAHSRKVRRLREDAEHFVARTIGRGRWEQDLFEEGFEQHVEEAAESLAGSLTRSVLWTVFTGRSEQMEQRADKLDHELEQRLQQRTQALEQHAMALCEQVLALDRVQSALEFRYNGQPLQMLRIEGEAVPAVPKEHAPDNSIALP